MGLTPEQQVHTDMAVDLIKQSLAMVKPRHRDIGVRIVDAFLRGPLHAGYQDAIARGQTALADTYVTVAAGFLADYLKESKVQSVQICALLLAKQEKGDGMSRGLLNVFARAGVTGPNPG